jgi:predicted nucleic acid-binding protein
MTRPRVVLDTNCLVSALIFSRGRFAWRAQLVGEGASGAPRVVQ